MAQNVPAYEPIRFYDVPGIAAAQLLEGEASATSIKDLVLSPDRLTPQERTDLGDMMMGSGEWDPFSKTLMGLVTNPWVWLYFLTMPVGFKAMQSGKSLFTIAKNVASQQRKSLSWLHFLKSDVEEFSGTALFPVSAGVANNLRNLHETSIARMQTVRNRLYARINEMLGHDPKRLSTWTVTEDKGLSSYAYREGTPEFDIVRKWEIAADAKVRGLDLDRKRRVKEVRERFYQEDMTTGEVSEILSTESPGDMIINRKIWLNRKGELRSQLWDEWKEMSARQKGTIYEVYGSAGAWVDDTVERAYWMKPEVIGPDRERIVQELGMVHGKWIDDALDEFGEVGKDYMRRANWERKWTFVQALGKEDAFLDRGVFEMDDVKLRRLATSLQRKIHSEEHQLFGRLEEGASSLQGKEALLSVLGPERFERLRAMAASTKQSNAVVRSMEDDLKRLVTPESWEGWWASRNVFDVNPVRTLGGKKIWPDLGLSPEIGKNVPLAPWAASRTFDDRLVPLTERDLMIHTDDLRYLEREGALTEAGKKHYEHAVRQVEDNWHPSGKKEHVNPRATLGMRLSHDAMHTSYLRNMHQAIAYDLSPATEAMLVADAEAIANLPEWKKELGTIVGYGSGRVRLGKDLSKLPDAIKARISPGALMDRIYMGESLPGARISPRQMRLRDSAVPGALMQAGPAYHSVYNNMIRQKEMAGRFADSLVGRFIEKLPGGKEFVGGLREFGDFSKPVRQVRGTESIARWMFMSHLGINMGSVILNLTQPLLLAGTVGRLDDVLGAYADAFGEMSRYTRNRLKKHGTRLINTDERRLLIGESFEFSGRESAGIDILQITPDMGNIMDVELHGISPFGRFEELMMKPFEKSEWFNRNVAAHLYKRVAKRAGLSPTSPTYWSDMQRFVLQTQFGQSPINTPYLFSRVPFFSDPVIRQFMTFPTRSLVGALSVFPRLGGVDNYFKGLANTTLRGVGMSAIVYEAGKGLLGADMSRGLYVSAATDLFGGTRIVERGNEWVPIPPIVDVPVSLLRGVAQEDMGMIADAVARTIPGGVAINRAIGIAGEMPRSIVANLPGALQKTYVDWANPTPDGLYGVYKGDGRLIEYRSGSEIVSRGFGVDLGSWQKQGGLDSYLVKQRDEILRYRQEYLRAVAANDLKKAARVQVEFGSRFKNPETGQPIPLTISETQMKAFLNRRSTGRTETLLQMLPRDQRGLYQQMAARSGAVGNVSRGALTRFGSARQRDVERHNAVTEQLVMEMMARHGRVGPGAQQSSGSFRPFASF